MAKSDEKNPSGGSGLTELSFRHLNRVRLVSEFGSVSRVAVYLKRSQTTITKSIREIEIELGVDLFERTTRGLRMTSLGSILYQRLGQAYQEFSLAREEFEAQNGDLSRPGLHAVFAMDVSNSRLKTLVTLCQTQNISRAASVVGVTVDAMYKTLHELEDQLGVILFERQPGANLIPTPFGVSFAERVRRASGEVEAAIQEIAIQSGRLGGRVVVGTMPRVRQLLMPRTIAALMEESPEIEMATQDGTYIWLEPALRSTMVDFVFGTLHSPVLETGLQAELIIHDRLIFVTRPDHPLQKKTRLSLNQLVDYPWILPPANSPQHRLVDRFLNENNLEIPKQIVRTNSFSTLKTLLVENDNVAVSSMCESYIEIKHGALKQLPVPLSEKNQLFPLNLLTRVNAIHTPAAKEFRKVLIKQAHLIAKELGLPIPPKFDAEES